MNKFLKVKEVNCNYYNYININKILFYKQLESGDNILVLTDLNEINVSEDFCIDYIEKIKSFKLYNDTPACSDDCNEDKYFSKEFYYYYFYKDDEIIDINKVYNIKQVEKELGFFKQDTYVYKTFLGYEVKTKKTTLYLKEEQLDILINKLEGEL
jgi:hypothetical protein